VHGLRAVLDAVPGLGDPGAGDTVEDLLIDTAIRAAAARPPRWTASAQVVEAAGEGVAQGHRRVPFHDFGEVVARRTRTWPAKLGWDAERRAELDREFAAVHRSWPSSRREDAPFYDLPEGKQKGTGGLLSITVNPEACKGCNICVDVCPDGALVTVKQDEEVVDRCAQLEVLAALPDTDDRFINIRPRRGHRRALVAAAEEEELPVDGRRRRRLHGLRREDRRAPGGLHHRGADAAAGEGFVGGSTT
jgi:ferredoxin